MTELDIWVSVGSVTVSATGIAYCVYILKTSGRDLQVDPEAVQRFIDTAPRWQDVATSLNGSRRTHRPASPDPDLVEKVRVVERRVGDHGLLYDVYVFERLELSLGVAPGLSDAERRHHAATRLELIWKADADVREQ